MLEIMNRKAKVASVNPRSELNGKGHPQKREAGELCALVQCEAEISIQPAQSELGLA